MIQIFTTGGTIDKVYFDALSEFQIGNPQVGRVLADAGVVDDYAVQSLLRKDSLEITEQDRALIRAQVQGCEAS